MPPPCLPVKIWGLGSPNPNLPAFHGCVWHGTSWWCIDVYSSGVQDVELVTFKLKLWRFFGISSKMLNLLDMCNIMYENNTLASWIDGIKNRWSKKPKVSAMTWQVPWSLHLRHALGQILGQILGHLGVDTGISFCKSYVVNKHFRYLKWRTPHHSSPI